MKKILPALILLVLMIATVFIAQYRFNTPSIPELYPVPGFDFNTQNGSPFTEEGLEGKVSVADFIFTNCPGICPMMTRKMSALYEDFSDNDKVQFVSFSVDPARDSLAALKAYADNWEVNDERWLFVQTNKTAIDDLYANGFKLGGELPRGHSAVFVLIDDNKTIRGYYNSDDEESLELLKTHIGLLAEEI